MRHFRSNKSVNNYGGRGMAFEELIGWVNETYKAKQIAAIEKIATPVTVLRMEGSRIRDGFYSKKSTVDYTGTYRRRSLWFDAKSTKNQSSFPLDLVEAHQVEHLIGHAANGAICFFLFWFTEQDAFYLMPLENFLVYWNRRFSGVRGSKSIPISAFQTNAIRVEKSVRGPLDYLAAVDRLIEAESI